MVRREVQFRKDNLKKLLPKDAWACVLRPVPPVGSVTRFNLTCKLKCRLVQFTCRQYFDAMQLKYLHLLLLYLKYWFLCSLSGIQTEPSSTNRLARQRQARGRAVLWISKRKVSERRFTDNVARSSWDISSDAVLRSSGHHQYIPQVENRAGDRGSAVEDRPARDSRVSRQRARVVA